MAHCGTKGPLGHQSESGRADKKEGATVWNLPYPSMRWTPLSVKSFSTISDEARGFLNIICKRNWDSSLESCLHKSELPITPGLVNDVLKSISEPKLALRLFLWAGKQPNYVHFHLEIDKVSARAWTGLLNLRWLGSIQFRLDLP